MRNIIILLITMLLLSCSVEEQKTVVDFKDIKSIIQDSRNVGGMFETPPTEETIITITYPDYLVESYQLLRFVTGLLSRDYTLSVYDPQLPLSSYPEDMLTKLREEAPLLAFEEYIDLYTYLQKREIKLISSMEERDGLLLYLIPESLNITPQTIDKNSIDILFAGTRNTLVLKDLIEELPETKKISAISVEDSPYSELLPEYDILIFMDNFDSYRAVTPVNKIYNEENYTTAPVEFQEETKSIITTYQIDRMNNYLSRLILNNIRRYED